MGIKIAEPTTAEDAQTTLATRSHDRDDDQKGIDATVAGMVKSYTGAGGEKVAPAARPSHRYQVPKADRPELKRMIRRACVLAKVDPVWYVDSKPDAQGNIIVKFTVGPQKVKPEATATPAAPAAPAPAPAPTPPDSEKRGGLLGSRRQ